MTISLDNPQAHEPLNPELRNLLAKTQGNILRGHGRNHTLNLFLRFTGDAVRIRETLKASLPGLITSALDQEKQRPPTGLFASFFLTAAGYGKLGFTREQIKAALPEGVGRVGFQSNFLEGMKAYRHELKDPPVGEWEENYRGQVDAMLLLAHDSAKEVATAAEAIQKRLTRVTEEVFCERGRAYRDVTGRGIEHFGYVDGISQPSFFVDQLARQGSTESWNPLAPLNLVLVPDGGVADPEAHGSFYVFRKLEQNVRGFRRREVALARELGLGEGDRDRVGAMVVGRFRDGTPLALAERPQAEQSNANDFVFENDRGRCPFHAHIRKVNPRGDLAAAIARPLEEVESPRRIVRRGITYGDRAAQPWHEQPEKDLPSEGVGVLFACFQSSIANQFAFIQSRWINRPDFPGGAGIDPLAGTPQPGDSNRWPTRWDGDDDKAADFGRFVTLKGGEFFFAPSIPFLSTMAPPR